MFPPGQPRIGADCEARAVRREVRRSAQGRSARRRLDFWAVPCARAAPTRAIAPPQTPPVGSREIASPDCVREKGDSNMRRSVGIRTSVLAVALLGSLVATVLPAQAITGGTEDTTNIYSNV